MSNVDIDSYEWLKTNITSKNINYIDCNELTGHKVIDKGGFGIVKSAEWNNRGIKVALKNLKEETLKEDVIKKFVKEVCYINLL